MQSIAIIPARGGSTRLPRKNILPVNGHPMLAYPVTTALSSGLFDAVIVSTEDEEIASIAQGYGAQVDHRPATLAQNHSTVVEVCHHLLQQKIYQSVNDFCCLYPTALFVTAEHLIQSKSLLDDSAQTDCVMGVSRFNYHPLRALRSVNGYLQSMWPEESCKQAQKLPELVVSNGSLYWAKTQSFKTRPSFYSHYLKGYPTPSIDIDTAEDYQQALHIARQQNLTLNMKTCSAKH